MPHSSTSPKPCSTWLQERHTASSPGKVRQTEEQKKALRLMEATTHSLRAAGQMAEGGGDAGSAPASGALSCTPDGGSAATPRQQQRQRQWQQQQENGAGDEAQSASALDSGEGLPQAEEPSRPPLQQGGAGGREGGGGGEGEGGPRSLCTIPDSRELDGEQEQERERERERERDGGEGVGVGLLVAASGELASSGRGRPSRRMERATSTSHKMTRRTMSVGGGPEQQRVAIIGTGMLGAALGGRLVEAGYFVAYGTRSGKARHKMNHECEVTTVKAAIFMGDVVVLAIPAPQIPALLQDSMSALVGKVVVEASNVGSYPVPAGVSMGEHVADLLPQASVVKAFNTVSAYQLKVAENTGGPRTIVLCGNSTTAKTMVASIIYNIGFTPIDLGGIKAAKRMEDMPRHFFHQWASALLVALCLALPILLYTILRDFDPRQHGESSSSAWEGFPANGMAGVFGWLAIYLLAATYSAGLLATLMRKPLPAWTIRWLTMRKQLGLLAFVCACLHGAAATLVLRPAYPRMAVLFLPDGRLKAVGETMLLIGLLALACLCVLAITSVPSVVSSLSWKEWDFIHKKMGWASVVLAFAHVAAYAPAVGAWRHPDSWPRNMPPSTLLACAPVFLLIGAKVWLVLRNVRREHVRRAKERLLPA